MSEFDEETSQEDRIKYLRERGIQIEIPGERNVEPKEGKPTSRTSRTIVKIPCNDSAPLAEVTVDVEDTGGDQLLNGLKPFFSETNDSFDMNKLKATLKEQHGNQDVQISEDALMRASAMGNVETFPIDHPNDDTGGKGVSIYLDEASQLKALPPNKRATALADSCGFKGVPFSGDVYVGRISMQKNGIITNDDFCLSDLDSTSDSGKWLKEAESRNYRHNSSLGKIDMHDTSNEPKLGDNTELGLTFTEQIDTMDMVYTLPAGIPDLGPKASKQIAVKFNQQNLRITSLVVGEGESDNRENKNKVLLDIPLFGKVDVDCCTWTANGARTIEISMEKLDEAIWGQVEK